MRPFDPAALAPWLPLLIPMIALVAIGGLLWLTSARYRKLYHPIHLSALIDGLPALRAAALERLDTPLAPPSESGGWDEPRVWSSNLGLSLIWQAEAHPKGQLHRWSLSRGGHALAFAAGGRFVHLLAWALGVPEERIFVAFSPAGVVHCGFVIPHGETAEFATRALQDADQSEEERAEALVSRLWKEGGAFVRTRRRGGLLRDEIELIQALRGAA